MRGRICDTSDALVTYLPASSNLLFKDARLCTCRGLCRDVSCESSSAESMAGIRAAHSEWPGISWCVPAAVAYMIAGV